MGNARLLISISIGNSSSNDCHRNMLGLWTCAELCHPTNSTIAPHPRSRSAGELVAILVSMQQCAIELSDKGNSSLNRKMEWHPEGGLTMLDVMIAALEQHHVTLLERLYSLDDATCNHSAWLLQGEQEIILRDTVGGLLWIALFDAVHHRGQLSAYIRPMGGKVPSIYGPSADSAARP
jgi:hypothetical protein